MTTQDRWLLPEGIEEALPSEAERLEDYRRRVLDLYHAWGYELVMPPFIEYLESLLTGAGSDLDLRMFKLTDQLTGRLMGVRADMTPQVARIDAHRLGRETPVRLCYLGTVLHTRPDGMAGSRSPLQLGAELFGHAGIDSDVEIIRLMLETLRATGHGTVHMDLGHVGIYRRLASQAGLNAGQEADLFDLLQRKALAEIGAYLKDLGLPARQHAMLFALGELNGDDEVLARARSLFEGADEALGAALDYLDAVAASVRRHDPQVELRFDLAELRGYHYHTGIVFAAFVPGQGQEVARGGRYDDIGKVFGRARPAVGFSTDLKILVGPADGASSEPVREGIFAPISADEGLQDKIRALRASGERVVCELSAQAGDAWAMGCDRELVRRENDWVIKGVANG